MPWYLPRSRGLTRSAMTPYAVTINPPPPSPCIARNPINWTMSRLMPDSTEPIRKIAIAAAKIFLRPYRSPSLPHRGGDRRSQEIGGDHPRKLVEASDDRRQRRGNNGLVQRCQQHAEHQRAEDQAYPWPRTLVRIRCDGRVHPPMMRPLPDTHKKGRPSGGSCRPGQRAQRRTGNRQYREARRPRPPGLSRPTRAQTKTPAQGRGSR